MIRKKLVIYGITCICFLLLLSLYFWSVISATERLNRQRLEESMGIFQSQIQKNLEYRIKDRQLDINELELQPPITPDQVVAGLMEDDYIADSEGVLYSDNGHLAGRKIETTVLKAADQKGFGIQAITDTSLSAQVIAMVSPLLGNEGFYLVSVMTPEVFLEQISEYSPLSGKPLFLLNEWGNCLGYYESEGSVVDPSMAASLEQGFATDQYQDANHNISRIGWSQTYRVYLPLEQPENWFLAYQVDYANGNMVTSMIPFSSLIMFVLLFLILAVVIALDVINDREKQREQVVAGSLDTVTGLISGTSMEVLVGSFIEKQATAGLSFVCMDVVAFGRINSMFGYAVGDDLLKLIADVIKKHYSCGVRVNADCFTFFSPSSEDMTTQLEQLFYESVKNNLGEEYIQMISFRFGIYPLPERKLGFREVYDGALLALKEAKKQYKKNCVIYNQALKDSKELQKSIELNMLHALSKEEFHVYVQPQFDLHGERCDRGETLIRWQSEFMGFLPPDQFIPVFESNGFILETDFFMLTSALEFLQKRMNEGKRLMTLAVNQSKVTISFPNYFERLKTLIEGFSVPLHYIELEITESTLENDWEMIVPLIHNIRKLGFHIAMDDFGSGFSSLNTLRILPIDILKIDKEFLKESDHSERSKKIIRSIINMARDLEIQVVCEGVETKEQLEFLREAQCDIIQGYYYSKPLPMDQFVLQYVQPEPQFKGRFI